MSKILFVATEGLPYIKSGGLADVIGSLPKALTLENHEVSVVLPLYKSIALKFREDFVAIKTFNVNYGFFKSVATVYCEKRDNVTFYFIQHAPYFERETMYGFADDGERFSYFQIAVLEMLHNLDYFPDVMHEHDWHTGMIPLLCKEKYAGDERYANIKHVFTIHNLAYQGNYPKEILESCLGLSMDFYHNGKCRFRDGISFMKSAIVYADKITTVSNTYASEIMTSYFGENMNEVLQLRRDDVWGIVNGIDTDLWNPTTDKYLAYPMKSEAAKAKNKMHLQERLGLRVSKETMVVAMITRLTWQKGLALLLDRIYDVMGNDIQLVILGNGDRDYENRLKDIEYRQKRRMCFYCGYNEELAHQIYAGADLFLMPSLFEPCGISQLIAMRYSTIPLVRETGGLKDTVKPYNQYTKEGYGFSFTSFNQDDFIYTLREAIDYYYDRHDEFKAMAKVCSKVDVSWAKSAKLYNELYAMLTNKD